MRSSHKKAQKAERAFVWLQYRSIPKFSRSVTEQDVLRDNSENISTQPHFGFQKDSPVQAQAATAAAALLEEI